MYAGLYQKKERYIDIVKALGGQFYGMTQKEIVGAIKVKSGGTLSKHLKNLLESGVVRQYPRYGKERVEQVYQLVDFFSLFYLRFVQGNTTRKGMWSSIHGTGTFFAWAGDTFELLAIQHLEQLQDALRIGFAFLRRDSAKRASSMALAAPSVASVDRNYCWRGLAPDGHTAQIDLVMESKASQTDFLCEMKFSMGKFSVTLEDEREILHRLSAFEASKMHASSQSIQVVLVTTMGLARGEHAGVVHRVVTLEDLFK